MNLNEHYHKLYTKSSQAIRAGNYKLDPQINDPSDSRFGITILIRPDEKTKAKIQLFLDELKAIEPQQYYYPDSDIHITVLSVISCHKGFSLNKIQLNDYIEIIQKSLIDTTAITINFKGITASSDAVMIQGFPTADALNDLRNKLRENFKKSHLQQSIDSRYTIATAHATIVRFQEKLQNPEELIRVIEKFRDTDFGNFTVDKLEFVYNDWYQRAKSTISLADFYI